MAVSLVSTGVTFPDNSTQTTAATGFGFKNRIINGAMVIDQRNAGASVTPTNQQYTLDRWLSLVTAASKFTVQQNAGSVTPPVGFTKYLGATSTSAYSLSAGDAFGQETRIEGVNTADLGWGTANAQTITVSFWVRSSLTGNFGVVIRNNANTRSYPALFAISSANTWEQKTLTIAGDTSGTWVTDTTGSGIKMTFGLGVGSTYNGTAGSWASAEYYGATGATSVVGTNGATFYITGVQLEKGSTATSFDYRPIGTELSLCQRYAVQLADGTNQVVATGQCLNTSGGGGVVRFPVEMRAAPTITASSAAHFSLTNSVGATAAMSGTSFLFASTKSFLCELTGRSGSGLVVGNATIIFATDSAARLLASAEL
jgi:hypothetical protein